MGIARVKLSDCIPQQNATTEHTTKPEEKEDALWVIMVPDVIPGELVRARIFRNHKQYSEADLIELIEPSPDRVEPLCKLAAECGGCQYQHMPIALQREWKTKHVEECFHQHNVDLTDHRIDVQLTMGTEHIYHYRSKITPHYEAPGGQSRKRGKKRRRRQKEATSPDQAEADATPASVEAIGFQRSSVRQIIDVPYCPIATEPLNEEYQRIRKVLLNQPYHKELGATLLFRQANLDNATVVTDHKEYMTTFVNGLSFTYLAGNFFQNNLHILPVMVDEVMGKASPPAETNDGNARKMTHFVDCYCGSGLFCLSAAKYFDVCVGIEINAKAIEEAERNAKANDLSHKCTFEAARAEAIFDNPNVQAFPQDTTVVCLDPPRKGCDETFLKQLESFRPQRIVYLSCNPATQARDVKSMVSWGYSITSIQPFDLFPQTRHIECLTILEHNS
jgi:tRNA (uracil-5-)-methyltransferase